MEKRLACFLIVVGWGFVVIGAIVLCSAVWSIAFEDQAGIAGNLIGAAMAVFGFTAGILFVLRSRKVLKGDS
jgi:hypothetical protein